MNSVLSSINYCLEAGPSHKRYYHINTHDVDDIFITININGNTTSNGVVG